MLQGTEPPDRHFKVVGFAQPGVTADFSEPVNGRLGAGAKDNGRHMAKSTIIPWRDEQARLFLRRARLGIRGRLPQPNGAFSEKLNYSVLLGAGQNLGTYRPFGNRDQAIALLDLSLTFNHLPGARIRFGLFKIPGPEESFQSISGFDYIEFSDFIGREILEIFATGNLAPAPAGGSPTAFTTYGKPVNQAYGFNSGRDWGIEIFDEFRLGPWDLSYALMIGNGDAIKVTDLRIDENFDRYIYLSSEYDLAGDNGSHEKNRIKFYSWYQSGERKFSSDRDNREFERIRYGFGFKGLGHFFGHDQRLSGELNYADGMIFYGPLGAIPGNPLRFAAEEGNRSRGFSVDYGFFLNPSWEFAFRYDRHDLLYQQAGPWTDQDERIIQTYTMGVVHHFRPKLRLTVNYLFRDHDAPNDVTLYDPQANAILNNNVNRTLNSLGDRIALQLTWIF